MPRAIRYRLDENVNSAVASGLRRLGFSVTTTTEAGLLAGDDSVYVAFARAENRAIFTQGDDFLILHHQGNPRLGLLFAVRVPFNRGDYS